jgi:hypothetical protein
MYSNVRPGTTLAGYMALLLASGAAAAQTNGPPQLRVGVLPTAGIIVDGALDEAAWQGADVIDAFTQAEPSEGAPPTTRTMVRVLAGSKALVIGIDCADSDPSGIVSFSVRRDAILTSEDHVRVVIGPFLDGRSGYVFAVNPSGARYDGLINPGGESDNPDWDGIWEAATARSSSGWSAEILIPIQSLSFKPGLREWHFNVERRVQRHLEIDRWASPARQYRVTQTSRGGLLTELPEFALGMGLTVRPAVTTGGGVPTPSASLEGEFQPSLDVTQRLGANFLASLTINTDFAETEVDTRRTNLTRFPLFFPEKRTFFLEGSDIFTFGLGLGQDVIPFFSRRIGLVGDAEVPIIAGGKLNGRVADTDIGAWIGAIATVGDPLGRTGSWLGGADFTYATSRLRGNKNLLAGVWALATDRAGLGRDKAAYGLTVDYPNDLWDINVIYKRIGRDFDPSLGFVPRRAVHMYRGQANNRTRLSQGPLQQLFHQFQPSLVTDLSGKWESYQVFIAPVNWRFRSGDRVEINVNPTGEQLVDPFGISGVIVPPGAYHWKRYRIEAGTAQKRRLYTQATWWFGGFYNGNLDQFEWTGAWNPTPLLTVEFTGERNIGDLATGRFTQTVVGNRIRVNVSPDLSISSYVQYDTDSDSVGTNTRLRWTFRPVADLFVVYNHNVRSLLDRWQRDSNQLLVKLQYAWRF